MDEVSCSSSTTCRFDVYIGSFSARRNIYNVTLVAVVPSVSIFRHVGGEGVLEGGDAGRGLHARSGKKLPGVRLRITERLSMAGSR